MKLQIVNIAVAIIVLCVIAHKRCECSPIVITPKQFRENIEENVAIISPNNQLIEILLNEVSPTNDLLFNKTFNVSKDEPLIVPISVAIISSYAVDKVILTVISESGEKSESYISLVLKSGYGFIQTDKPIYTPKENVRLRMIRVDQQLKPITEKFKLRIKNSQRIIVEETTLTSSEPNYFVDYTFEFPPAPKLGLWNAELLFGKNYLFNYSVTFEVKEYILPTFSIKIISPQFILPSSENVFGSVRVDYVYGKPVNGSVVFKFGVKEKNGRITFFGSTDLKPLVNGSASYLFSTNQIRQFSPNMWFPAINGNKFVVEVTVHERVTGKKDKAIDDNGLFVTSPYVISFKNSFSDFMPDIETFVTGEVLNMAGKPVAHMPVSLNLMDESGRPIIPKHISSNLDSSQLISDDLGRISFPIILKKGIEQLHVTLRTNDPNCTRDEQAEGAHVLFAHDSEDGFISIINKSKNSTTLAVGETYRSSFVIRGSILSDQMYLLIINRGSILSLSKIFNNEEIKINITRLMMPDFRILVIALSRLHNLIADSVKINVYENDCGFNLKVLNNLDDIKPGSSIKIMLNGSKFDSVALLGVDEAVYVLRDSDRLTKAKVSNELLKSDTGCGPGGGRNVFDSFNNVGLKFTSPESHFSDDKIHSFCHKSVRVKRDTSYIVNRYQGRTRKCCVMGMMPSNRNRNCNHKAAILKNHLPADLECHYAFLNCCVSASKPIIQFSVATTSTGLLPSDTRTRTSGTEYVHPAYEEELEKNALVRNDFRETWLFDIVVLDHNSVIHEVNLPHSITTWSLFGMSLSPTNGLCLMPSPLRLRSFQDVFIQLSLPYSVVQNEQMELIATVFNYREKRLHVLIYFYGVENLCSEAIEPGSKAKKSLAVEANSFGTVAFPMVPLQVGEYTLKVTALWPTGGDVVEKVLVVMPPGIPVEEDFTFQLDPLNRQKRKKRSIVTTRLTDEIIPEKGLQNTEVKITYQHQSEKIVPNTKACIISGIADQFGVTAQTTLADIDQLIRQPKGCGEQTMLYMAPTLYTLKYLDSIDRLSGDSKHRALKYLREGYKRELSFRKDDGSFSAFPIRPSSIWLTAFVMKVFCQTAPYLPEDRFDDNVIRTGIEYIFSKQQSNGSWIEKSGHSVIHESSLGGVKGAVPLTAYIVIALHECKNLIPSLNRFKSRLAKAEDFLLSSQEEIIKQRDTYAMGLMAYSLTFTDNQNSFRLLEVLNNYSNIDNSKNYKYWRNSHDVEATSYAFLAFLNSGPKSSIDGISIANWLNARRTYSGSFDSTQDTIVALEALSQFASSQTSLTSSLNMVCNVSSSNRRFTRSINFHKDNALILQKFQVDSDSDALTFTTTGNGMGHMLIKLKYNVLEPPEVLCKFDMNIKVNEWRDSIAREETEFDNDIGEDFFSEFPSELISSLDFKAKRTKRSFWNSGSMRRTLDRLGFGTERSTERTTERSDTLLSSDRNKVSDINEVNNLNIDESIEKNNLSAKRIENKGVSKLVLILEICVRYTMRYNSEMTIIEVGLISGYKANNDDLEEIINSRDSLVSKYEISDRNVVFYLDRVPFGRPYCIQFRLIQEHSVSNSQAAIIKVYDYYKMDHGCSQLYTPTRISEYIETKCDSDVCLCAKRENCPSSKSLTEIGTIFEKKVLRSRELFEDLVCNPKYHFVYTGKIIQQNDTKHGFKLFMFRVRTSFKGNSRMNTNIWLTMNGECNDSATNVDSDAIIFGQIYDNTNHLNGSSIIYDITNDFKSEVTRRNVLSLVEWLDNKVKRDDWRCAQ